ncbi:unnamed protein product [Chrysodeixis includens]|uniref:Uncharacterized protein n=1 Tax=Chrysodeixis includens TaxID=689277 RepID=A0A9N8Q1K5_CHRIL|nr:unnamed protein product [Chrysodeixis includens]
MGYWHIPLQPGGSTPGVSLQILLPHMNSPFFTCISKGFLGTPPLTPALTSRRCLVPSASKCGRLISTSSFSRRDCMGVASATARQTAKSNRIIFMLYTSNCFGGT